MKRLLLCGLVTTLTTCAIAAQSPTLKADHKVEGEQQLLKAERDWSEAQKRRDKRALGQLCSEEFCFTDDEGVVSKRSKYLDDTTGRTRIASYTLSDLTATLYGGTGIVRGRWKGEFRVDDMDVSGLYQFTDTFVRREGRWWAVASHASRVPDDQP